MYKNINCLLTATLSGLYLISFLCYNTIIPFW